MADGVRATESGAIRVSEDMLRRVTEGYVAVWSSQSDTATTWTTQTPSSVTWTTVTPSSVTWTESA